MNRRYILLLLSFWLAFGQVAGTLAQSADQPCESMGMSMPADDFCGEGMDLAKCVSTCAASAPAVTSGGTQVSPLAGGFAVAARLVVRHPDVSAPPDVAPPKPFVS